jgi:pantoate--beta-alanine ligase
MIIFKTIADLQQYIENQRKAGNTIGFVPTMGALHHGHLSLIKACRQQHPITVCSIFVNPTQFNDPSDFNKYPVTIEKDCLMLEQEQTDILFLPSVNEMYPFGKDLNKHYDLGTLETILDGAYRPGHFQGVCQVVERLLTIVKPDEIFIGQKDFQQCMVITRLVEIMEQAIKVSIIPTLREADGLAMSSRNVRLNETERQIAPGIYKQLSLIKESIAQTEIAELKNTAIRNLLDAGFTKVDYVEIAEAGNLEPLQSFHPNKKTVALVAAFINEVRLIDNMVLN